MQCRGEELLLPTDSLFSQHPILLLKSDKLEKRVRCGNPISLPGTADGTYRVYSQDRQFLCLVSGQGRHPDFHQEFLWSVIIMSIKEKVIALGFFDGVHLGHGALLRRTAEEAAARGVTPAVFTFDRPPQGGHHRPALSSHQLGGGPPGADPPPLRHRRGADGALRPRDDDHPLGRF